MQGVRFHRLSVAGGDLIFACMKNLPSVPLPDAAELYALEHEARRLRAAEMARLFRVAAQRLRMRSWASERERTASCVTNS